MADEDVKNDLRDNQEETAQDLESDELSDYEKSEQKKKKTIYMIIFAVQLVLAFVLIKFVIFPWYNNDETDEFSELMDEIEEEQVSNERKEIGHIFTISNLTVNPSGSRGRRFAVFEIALSVPQADLIEEIKKYETVIKDNYIQYFRAKTVEDLSTDTAVVVIKSDLLDITNNIVGSKKINDIYFTRFILQ